MKTITFFLIISLIAVALVEYIAFGREPSNFHIFVFIGLTWVHIADELNDILNVIERKNDDRR